MSELLEYLRGRVTQAAYEAAERMDGEIAQLRAENDRLREALRLLTQDEWHDECGDVRWWHSYSIKREQGEVRKLEGSTRCKL